MVKEIKITKDILIQKKRELTEIEGQVQEYAFLSNNLMAVIKSLS
jgi:hypothetical protein